MIEDKPSPYQEALAEVRKQLDWRGPGGKPQKHVVLERNLAQHLFTPEYNNQLITKTQYAEALRKIGKLSQALRKLQGASNDPNSD